MRHPLLVSLCLGGAVLVSACDQTKGNAVDRKLQDVNVIDETNMSEVMLTVADPNAAVSYFQKAVEQKPDRIDLARGLATSLVRAKRTTEGVVAWRKVLAYKDAQHSDRVELADALIRSGKWDEAEAELDKIPPTHETYERYRLEAMIADKNQEWDKADSFYEIALGLTTKPAGVMNNWGFSKLTRGDYAEAERLFADAIRNDETLFTAKNNLVLARAAQRNYTVPVMPMSQVERAQLLYTMALSAVKQGDVETGKTLLREAIETNPQYFEEAQRSLDALEKA